MNDLNLKLLSKWILVTFLGCVIGLILAIVLSYAIVNPFYPKETNLLVGLCVGACVGAGQMLVMKKHYKLTWRWILGPAIGLGIPFIVIVIMEEMSPGTSNLLPGSVIIPVIFLLSGGLLTGWIQITALKTRSVNRRWWILISTAGWGLADLVNVYLPGVGILVGILLLGTITGLGIMWLLEIKKP